MNIRLLILITSSFGFLATDCPVHATDRYCPDEGARTLTVEMYPFVPKAEGMALQIKELFERGCPGLDLELNRNPNYYSSDETGLLARDADVYEVDSVFFQDFLVQKKPKPPSQSVIDAAGQTVAFAKTAATDNTIQIGVPHWLCSDFLIFEKERRELANLKTPSEAAQIFHQIGKGLLMDVKGSSTLGELYLSILVAHYGSVPEALQRLDPDDLDDYAIKTLQSFVAMEPAGFGRDKEYHNREGFYPRQFARRKGSAYVGYAEDTYYALWESQQNCVIDECLTPADIEVAPWPFADQGVKPVAWVDMYMMDNKLDGVKLRDAEAFVKFMMSPATYKALLIPEEGDLPRYLLPARDELYADSDFISLALYAKFRSIISNATPVSDKNLNARLRGVASKIEQQGLLGNH